MQLSAHAVSWQLLSWFNSSVLMHKQGHTKSQNVRGWKGPLWVTQSSPLPKQGHPEQAAQDRVQAGLEYLQRRRLHSLTEQPGPGLRHPQREEVLPHVQLELPVLQFVPIAPCLVAGHQWKESTQVIWMAIYECLGSWNALVFLLLARETKVLESKGVLLQDWSHFVSALLVLRSTAEISFIYKLVSS